MKKTLKSFDFRDKKVLVRADFNVPLKNNIITNDDRIVKSIPTIEYIIENGGSVILLSHLGRPKGKYAEEFSLLPVANRLEEILGRKVKFIASEEVVSDSVISEIKELKSGEVALLENTRFVAGEEKNDDEFARKLASLADIYVNDAFGTSHRAHASNVGVSKYLPSALGLLVEKEVKYISGALKNPQRPFIAIIGGAKVSDKIGVIENLLDKVDKIVIVGAMAYTFLKAQGYETGKSLVENDKLELASALIKKAEIKKVKLILPIDSIVVPEIKEGVVSKAADYNLMPKDLMGVDIGPKSIKLIVEELKDAKTVVWNGPAGVFEIDDFAKGTFAIAKALAELDGAITIIGGGDSASAIEKSGVEDRISHISTGGGASLEMLEGKNLPGIDAIEEE
ncbi:phosphoglycerate kinase [Peptoniphilus sp. oral taxon 386]|uniref:phosphoglycerate kinase n=1 Tax=Peptoniphilus sp. oral taxon 386 TaxID=652713 RepID=UPI0001DA9A98|nr:phosphoglycerate kinase [Peptoniphilus sp. oral taxon 386]EFI41970.1 phosphoglycerate kinase [Peptoniphilus sp. oral taxon 386 str. F0131]